MRQNLSYLSRGEETFYCNFNGTLLLILPRFDQHFTYKKQAVTISDGTMIETENQLKMT